MALYKIVSGSLSGCTNGEPVEISDKDYAVLSKDPKLKLEPVSTAKPAPAKLAPAQPKPKDSKNESSSDRI